MGIACGIDPLEEGDIEGDNPVRDCSAMFSHNALSKSRVVWEYNPKWVVNLT